MKRAALLIVATGLAVVFLMGWTPNPADPSDKVLQRPAARMFDVGEFRTAGRSDADAIESAIDAAVANGEPNRTVRFPPGVYELDRPIRFASGMHYVAADGAAVILRAKRSDGITIVHDTDRPLRDVTITGLTFDNVAIRLSGDEDHDAVVDVTLRDCVFRNGRPSPEWDEAYLRLRRTVGVTVDGCQFLRDRDHPGRGIVADKTRVTVIKDSYFGTTPNLEPEVPNGYFRTAINIWGHDRDSGVGNDEVVVDGNVWRRTPGIGTPADCQYCQDHGLYAWGSRRLAIVDNIADGWDATPLGGSMKLRNLTDTVVVGNRLRSSGIYTYVYASDYMPEVFRRVSIRDNAVDMQGAQGCRHYCGVTYWRAASVPGSDGVPERDIFIKANTFIDGGDISVSTPAGQAFCVAGNRGATLTTHLDAVQTSDCGDAPAWEDPFAGVHRGDFNGDGSEDFLHLVRERDKDPYWRAHLSAGAGMRVERWPARLSDSAGGSDVRARHGVHVGDFDGDSRDDLAYVGRCPDEFCWLVSRATDASLAPPERWAALGKVTSETRSYGFHVGDFDGDGLDDVLSRGSCAEDDTCWRLLRSDGRSFYDRAAGDGAAWSTESARFGLLVGDYDGDGTDDVAYRGVCGKKRSPCFRVHRGSPHGLTVHDWGNDVWFARAGESRHLGLRVADTDGDGQDDIGYVGRCGAGMSTQWRHHISTRSGFAVRCSPSPVIDSD